MKIVNIVNNYKQFGVWGFINQATKKILCKFGISYGRHNFLVCNLTNVDIEKKWAERRISNAKKLEFEDFFLGDKNIFTDEKLSIIKKRLTSGKYCAYGLVEEGRLVYSCWTSDEEFQVQDNAPMTILDSSTCLFLDTYCSPSYRGRGLQKAFVTYCLMQIYTKHEKTTAIVTTLVENKPSTMSYLHSGFELAFKYDTFSIGTYMWNNFNRKEKQWKETIVT